MVMETMTKIALSKKRMSDLKKDIVRIEMDINQTKEDLEEYTLFLYTLSNQLYGRGRSINDVGLFVKSDNIAESLSQNDMIQMLTKQLQVLIDTMKEKQENYAASIKKINVAKMVYYEASRDLQRDLDALEEQKTSLYELLSYLQSTKNVATSAVANLRTSQDTLQQEIQTMQTITNSFRLQ
jgi:peptidoglycan hydrolase CwlO-like protein